MMGCMPDSRSFLGFRLCDCPTWKSPLNSSRSPLSTHPYTQHFATAPSHWHLANSFKKRPVFLISKPSPSSTRSPTHVLRLALLSKTRSNIHAPRPSIGTFFGVVKGSKVLRTSFWVYGWSCGRTSQSLWKMRTLWRIIWGTLYQPSLEMVGGLCKAWMLRFVLLSGMSAYQVLPFD